MGSVPRTAGKKGRNIGGESRKEGWKAAASLHSLGVGVPAGGRAANHAAGACPVHCHPRSGASPRLAPRRAGWLMTAAALALLAVGCVPDVGVTPVVTPPPAASLDPAPVADAVDIRVCIDGSPSVDPALVASFVAALAGTLEKWPQPMPTDPSKGVAASPGLRLTVRKVLANSLDPNALIGVFTVPAVPGVVAKPALLSSSDVSARAAWGRQLEAATSASDDAQTAATTAAQALQDADLTSDASDVGGCIDALTLSPPPDQPLLLLVFSDLRQQTATRDEPRLASFAGARVLVVNADLKPRRAYKDQQFLANWISDQGAQVDFVRPEMASDAVRQFIVGGASS